MTAIRAIETVYKGYRFRSRLEARWAVFFDALGVDWDYEPEGFDLDGTHYLPDFWLKTVEMWAEVKAGPLNPEELRKCRLLANATWRPVLKLVGVPTFRAYWAVQPEEMDQPLELDYLLDDQYVDSERRFFSAPCCSNEADANPDFVQSERTRAAYAAARGARFEHGEHGRQPTQEAARRRAERDDTAAWLFHWLTQHPPHSVAPKPARQAAAVGPSVGVGPVRAKVLESICVECAGEVRPGRGTRTPDGSAWLCADCAGRPRSARGHAPTPAPVKQATPRPVRAIGLPVNPLADANAPALMRVDADAFERFKAQRAIPPVGQRGRAR